MNPIKFAVRRPVTTLMVVVALIGGGVFGLKKMRADHYPPQKTPKVYVYLDYVEARAKQAKGYIVGQFESYFHKHEEESHEEHHKVVVTSPKLNNVTITQPYVCQIHSQRHINVRALDSGYLEAISVKEGQAVKKGDSMFKIVPTLYQAKRDAEKAESQTSWRNWSSITPGSCPQQKVVSKNDVLIHCWRPKSGKGPGQGGPGEGRIELYQRYGTFSTASSTISTSNWAALDQAGRHPHDLVR